MDLYEKSRLLIKQILDEKDPADAPTAYYALDLPPARRKLAIEQDEQSQRVGFAVRCQTGFDLFRPLVTMRCFGPHIAARLLAALLEVGRPYIFFARRDQFPLGQHVLHVEEQKVLHIYRLDPARFKPVVNVMVRHNTASDGMPRCEIYSGGLQAVAGVNWASRRFAEVFVHTEPEARRRGWGRSVVMACTEQLLKSEKMPLYLLEQGNDAARELARSVGYVDTGARQIYAEVVYTGGADSS